jgi:hypothetical protein
MVRRPQFRSALAITIAAAAIAPAGAAGGPAVAGTPCSWYVQSNADAVNVAYPDESANYWGTQMVQIPKTGLVIRGRYPDARYFSIHAYDPGLRPVGALRDEQIDPATGVNPFRPPARLEKKKRRNGSYVLTILPEAKPANPAPNTIYAGATSEGYPNPQGIVLYRVYVPRSPKDPTGAVGLPDVSFRAGDGAVEVPMGQCDVTGGLPASGLNEAVKSADYPDPLRPPVAGRTETDPPTWNKFFGYSSLLGQAGGGPVADASPFSGGGGFLSNVDNDYIGAPFNRHYGDVLVFRAHMPTFPDTQAGDPTYARRQLRYWSICQNETYSQRYVACIADYQAVLDRNGFGTFVVADPGDRPKNADREHRVNWLPWGGAYPDGRIIYRQMVASPSFAQAFEPVGPKDNLKAALGDYYPVTAYCTKERFEQGGAPACLASP